MSLFIGGTLTATSIGITVRVLADLKRQHAPEGQIVLGAAVLDDVLGVALLSLLYEFSVGGGISLVNTGKVLMFVVAFFVLAPIAAKLISVIINRYDAKSEIPGLIPTTIVALLPLIEAPLAEMTRQHPKLHVTLHLGDDGPSVRQREVDVALGIMRRPPQGCWGRKVKQFPVGVFATREAAARQPRRWLVRSLSEVTSPESAWERAHAQHLAARAPFHALVDLCAAGMGLGLMPRVIAARHPGLVELREFAPKLGSLERTAWLLCHPDHRRTARVVALMNALSRI